VLAGAVLAAVGLEAAQLFIPGRDARLVDAVVKALGAALGVQLGLAALLLRRAGTRQAPAAAPVSAQAVQATNAP
jgi:VanZ family protein